MLSFRRDLGADLIPRSLKFCLLPEIQEIIDVPDDVEISVRSFDVLRPTLVHLVARWKERQLSRLAIAVREQVDLPNGVDPAKLAVGQYYSCGRCRAAHSLQDALAYPSHLTESTPTQKTPYDEAEGMDGCTAPFRSLAVETRKILEVCEMDYTRCTTEEMDALEVRFYCRKCSSIPIKDAEIWPVMTWRVAVSLVPLLEQSTLTLNRSQRI